MTTKPSSPQDEPKIPTEGEIATLPRGARVAFAARCARRVQPLFTHFWPDAPRKHVEAIDNAIALAERRFVGSRSASVKTAYAARAAAAAAAAARAADIRSLIRQDFDQLQSRAKSEGWTDGTPVPPEVFGPMWPDGVPEGWPGRKAPDDRSWIVGPLASLPHLARVAVAVRATRRVQSLLDLSISSKHEELQRGIEEILSAAERAIATGRTSEIGSSLLKKLGFDSEHGPTTPMAGAVLTEVLFATQHTLTAFLKSSDPATESNTDTQAVLDAIEWAERAMQSANFDSTSQAAFFDAVAHDLQLLAGRSSKNNWSDRDPIDLASLGDLWNNNPPHELRRDESDRRLRIEISLPEDASDEDVERVVSDLILATSQRHQQLRGSGLKVDMLYIDSTSPVPTGGAR